MHPLEYCAKIFDYQYKEIAEELGVSKQTITDYIKGKTRYIPKKHLPKLSELFNGIDPTFFNKKELNEVEELDVQIAHIEKLSAKEYEEVETDGEILISDPLSSERSRLYSLRNKKVLVNKIFEHIADGDNSHKSSVVKQIVNVFEERSRDEIDALYIFTYILSTNWGKPAGMRKKDEQLMEDLKDVLKKHLDIEII
ncbi:helix-turn-helix domain-containing protein [Alteribacillus bidgolensis]|uniref:Helix-turn-helix n=1 Tax=Alteribacillus bidgolensis TaxID=930129 RepID=A0A1G8JGN9_9BACI|nr:helix-turn-helix transcriptional regulator [Alteribacillus bidgolensis]SDI30444.1 Helix-turn-helix [Alteribacillus bidgolensis]